MRQSPAALVVFVMILAAAAPSARAQDAQGLALVHARLMAEGLAELERQQGRLQESWALVDAGNAALLDAQRKETSLRNLKNQEEKLQQLEAQLLMRIFEVQRARRDIITNRAIMEAAGATSAERAGGQGILTGSWEFTVQPGLKGTAYLVQQGTLVSGTYELSGDWAGSLRGTFVANKIRLERIDSKLGFVAIFYGELDRGEGSDVLQGRWEATQLATGMPSAGGWRAERGD